MRLQTGSDIGRVWAVALGVFALSVVVVRSIRRSPGATMPALAIGYVGLLALGAAMGVSTRWTYRAGPSSAAVRVAIFAALALGYLLLLVALVFPFL